MNNTLIKTNPETYIVTDEKGNVKVVKTNITESKMNEIVVAENKIEELERELKSKKLELKTLHNKKTIAQFKPIYTITIAVLCMSLASSMTELNIILQLLIAATPFTISEVLARYILGTKKQRNKEERNLICEVTSIEQDINDHVEFINEYQQQLKCIDINKHNKERMVIKPIDHTLDSISVNLTKKKTK